MDQADQPHQPDPGAGHPDRAQQVRDQDARQRSVDRASSLFRFSQVELPWALGPPDGRYLLRPGEDAISAAPSHVLVLATLGAPERRLLKAIRKRSNAEPEPEPTPVATSRATIIDVGAPFPGSTEAQAWLDHAGEDELATDLAVLNRALHAFRVATADPYVNAVGRRQALVARVGYGAGEEVAEGLWTNARELAPESARRRRAAVLGPQARLAAVLNGRDRALACEELTLRARLDLDHGRDREAALQVLVALDAALAELSGESLEVQGRLAELRGQREPVAVAAQAALAGPLSPEQREAVEFTVNRIEAALRARAVTKV